MPMPTRASRRLTGPPVDGSRRPPGGLCHERQDDAAGRRPHRPHGAPQRHRGHHRRQRRLRAGIGRRAVEPARPGRLGAGARHVGRRAPRRAGESHGRQQRSHAGSGASAPRAWRLLWPSSSPGPTTWATWAEATWRPTRTGSRLLSTPSAASPSCGRRSLTPTRRWPQPGTPRCPTSPPDAPTSGSATGPRQLAGHPEYLESDRVHMTVGPHGGYVAMSDFVAGCVAQART